MPYRYGNKRTVTIWIDEDFLYHVLTIAEDLGYDSFSSFVNDLLREVAAAYELTKQLHIKDRFAKRKLTLEYIFSKIRTVLLHR